MVRRVVVVVASLLLLVGCPEQCKPSPETSVQLFEVVPDAVPHGGLVTVTWKVVSPGADAEWPSCSLSRRPEGMAADAVEAFEVACEGELTERVEAPPEASYVHYQLNALKRPIDRSSPYVTATRRVDLETWVADLVIAFPIGASIMDGIVRDDPSASAWHRHVFDGLTVYDRDGVIQPWIITAWESLTPTRWRFTVREGVQFHDGAAMTAEDVAFSIARVAGDADGGRRWPFTNIVTAIASDGGTVEVTTQEPDPLLPRHLAAVHVVPKDMLASMGETAFAEAPIGTGPYRFVRWEAGDRLELHAHPGFWGEVPEFERVRLEVIPDGVDRVDALMAGAVDIAVEVPTLELPRVEAAPDAYLTQVPGLRLVYLAMDQVRADTPGMIGTNPFVDGRVRRALAHAIDVDFLTDGVLTASARPASQFYTPFNEGFDVSIERLPYDVERARELLAEAGRPTGLGGLRFDVPDGRFRSDTIVASAIADMLEVVGIDVTVNAVPSAAFFEDHYESGDSTLALSSWTSFDTSRTLASIFHCWDEDVGLGHLNRFWYCNPAVDGMIRSANALFDPTDRATAYTGIMLQAQVDDVAYVPLYYENVVVAIRTGLAYQARPDAIVLAEEVTAVD